MIELSLPSLGAKSIQCLPRLAFAALHLYVVAYRFLAPVARLLENLLCALLYYLTFNSRFDGTVVKKRGKTPRFPKTIAFIFLEPCDKPEAIKRLIELMYRTFEAGIESIQVYEAGGSIKPSVNLLRYQLQSFPGINPRFQVGFQCSNDSIDTETSLVTSIMETSSSLKSEADVCDFVERHTHALSEDVHSPPETAARSRRRRRSAARHNVYLLDHSDGLNGLLEKLKEKKVSNLDKYKDLNNIDALYDIIKTFGGEELVLEPNIVLVFGPILTLAGFPVWLVRHSEIYLVNNKVASADDVITAALSKFTKTSQRFGR